MSEPDPTVFTFREYEGDELTVEHAVFQAIGAASVCWESLTGAGEFQSDRAKAIGDALLDVIRRATAPHVDTNLIARLVERTSDPTLHRPGDLALIAEAAAALRPRTVPVSDELDVLPDPEATDAQP